MAGIGLVDSPIPILGCGPGWLVTEKPSGMSIHNEPGADLCSLLKQYIASNQLAANVLKFDTQYGVHPVHRLDKDTSGVILLSCNRRIFDILARQFSQGNVTKQYLALVHGAVPPTVGWGRWQWSLTAKASGRRNPKGHGRRKPCETQYRILKHTRHYSLVECRLATGRTHQIRRHAVLAGHPLVGDKRYGSLRACHYLEKKYNFKRFGLHASGLTLRPPDTDTLQNFTSKGIPSEIERLIYDDEETA